MNTPTNSPLDNSQSPPDNPHGTLEELAQGYLNSIESQRVIANASMHHIQSLKNALAGAQDELSKANEATAKAKAECEEARKEVWKQADAARVEREEARNDIRKAHEEADKKVERMRAQVDELQSKLQATHAELRDFDWLGAKYAALKEQYAVAQDELKEYRRQSLPRVRSPILSPLQFPLPARPTSQMSDVVRLERSTYDRPAPKTPNYSYSRSSTTPLTSEKSKDPRIRDQDCVFTPRTVDVEMAFDYEPNAKLGPETVEVQYLAISLSFL
ncbi:hypothetical protein MIND_00596000 [Mycena indigotica]|uniref:Uncharacterized protein n=1 Tax=Mycena indigotica TaxID=2126181 RepID=A0A8H6SQI6_9AGAR|nr:uncharacterized protein MIND_00596000 [Mycena indigotica]KAF7303666.1 hypothetical protein MIND_00596000 [Mycena indigotica]